MNKMFKVFAICAISFLVVTGCSCQKKTDKDNDNKTNEDIKANTNDEVIKDQEIDVFSFTKTSLIYENGTSTLETTVTNNSDETQYLKEFKIIVKDSEGNEIVTMTGFIGDSIEAKASRVIDSTYGEDLTNAASIEYEVVK